MPAHLNMETPYWAQRVIERIERTGMTVDELGPYYDHHCRAVRATLYLRPGSADELTQIEAVQKAIDLGKLMRVGAQVESLVDVYDEAGDRWELEVVFKQTQQQLAVELLEEARRYLTRPAIRAELRTCWECGMGIEDIARAFPEAHADMCGRWPKAHWVMALRAVLEQEASVASERRAA